MRDRNKIEENLQKDVELVKSATQQQVHIEAAILETLLDIRDLLIKLNH